MQKKLRYSLNRLFAHFFSCALVLCVFSAGMTDVYAQPTHWRTLRPGLAYARLPVSQSLTPGVLHAFRIDLQRFRLKLGYAKRARPHQAGLRYLARRYGAVLVSNGGFFGMGGKPLGLRISGGKVQSRLSPVSWWGVFYMRRGRPFVVSRRAFRRQPGIEFAIQSGPRLLVHGQIPRLRPGDDRRTALCITRQGRVVLMATENAMLSTTALAQMLRRSESQGGLGCVDALNLDGGASTQLYAQTGHFRLDLPGYTRIADAVLVIPKKVL